MSDAQPKKQSKPTKSSSGKQVSKGRKIVTGIVLVLLLVVLGIEGRAGFGHALAVKALQKEAPHGVFDPTSLTEEQFNSKLPLWPKVTEVTKTDTSVEYKYEWYSFLRPRMENLPPSVLYATFSNSEPRYALNFGAEPDDRIDRVALTKDAKNTGGGSMSIFDDEPTDDPDAVFGGGSKKEDSEDGAKKSDDSDEEKT